MLSCEGDRLLDADRVRLVGVILRDLGEAVALAFFCASVRWPADSAVFMMRFQNAVLLRISSVLGLYLCWLQPKYVFSDISIAGSKLTVRLRVFHILARLLEFPAILKSST